MIKISIRLDDPVGANIDAFAAARGMSRAAATELFVIRGMREFSRDELIFELMDKIESIENALAKSFETLYRASTYLTMATQMDEPRFENASAAAARAKQEIFQ
ncbi:MAG: hypothetical protein AB1722_09650 [Pseudomonadota bacterium]